MEKETSRPEAAFVLMLMQATFWVGAGLSAFPFALAGEIYMIALGLASLVLAAFAGTLAVGLVRRRPRARRRALVLEVACLAGSLILLAVPIGANRGPVSLLVNVGVPMVLIVLLRGKRMRTIFAAAGAPR